MSELLKDKVCVITGAAKGIGSAIAERFAADGAILYIIDLDSDNLLRMSEHLHSRYNVFVKPVCADICDIAKMKQTIMSINTAHKSIDVLVNNAGIVSYEPMLLIDNNKLKRMFDVNVFALLNMLQLVSKLMIRQKSGSIINMASIVGVKGAKGQVGYSASKGAVISITKSASKELAEYGVRVNAIAPGMVATERFLKEIRGKFEDKLLNVGMKRFATPEDIADAFSFFASDRSKYITGQVLEVEGSFSL